VASVQDDDQCLCLEWKDKHKVTLLSTYHDDRMVTKSRRSRGAHGGLEDIQKPVVGEE
jgi:hypothetical protein